MSKKLVSLFGMMALIVSMVAVVPAAAEGEVTPEATATEESAPTEEVTEAAPTDVVEATETPVPEETATETAESEVTPSPETTPESTETTEAETSALVVEESSVLPTPEPGSIVLVKKTAEGSAERQWTWIIEKTADQSSLILSAGQSFLVNYAVTATATAIDGAWSVSGQITFRNSSEIAVMVLDVVDTLSDGTVATVTCPFTFPHNLPAGFARVCTYTASGSGAPPATNTADVYISDGAGGTLLGGSGTVAVTYAAATTVDECIDVVDSLQGVLGTVCADGSTTFTFTYSRTIGPYDTCGAHEVHNVASFQTNDSGSTGSDDWTVDISVPCAGGCSLTPGYWKTHSSNGPAPYDDTWALLGEGTAFFSSGQTYYSALWVSPQGHAYWILAHAYIAAVLNGLNGADTSSISGTLSHAAALLTAYSPSGSLSKTVRADFIATASILDAYNNGLIGPGHCSE